MTTQFSKWGNRDSGLCAHVARDRCEGEESLRSFSATGPNLRLAEMRSGEMGLLRHCDLELNGETWIYRPAKHKTLHLGHERVVRIGVKGQRVLRPLLTDDLTAYVFSPRRAREERFAAKRALRKTKVQPSQRNRREGTANQPVSILATA